MVLSTSGGKSPWTSTSRPGTRHGVFRGLDVGAKGCPDSEKEGPSSEGFTREGLLGGAWAPGTRSGWANRAELARPAPCPPWLCTRSVQVGSLGETHFAPVHLYWVFPRTGSRTTGSERFLARRTGLPELRRTLPKSAGPPGVQSPLSWQCSSWELVGHTVEHTWDMNGAKRPQMLLTSEKMAGELRHATGAQTTFTVDVRNGCSVVCTDQHMLAL